MQKEKQFNYVYITTNLITGKQYIGDHSTNDLNDKYLGSGIILTQAFKKYNRSNFKKEILDNSFKSKQEAFNAQVKYIQEYNTLSPNGYNISPKGGHQCNEAFSNATKEKIKAKRKLQKSNAGWHHSEETKKNMSKSHTGKKMSDESKQKNKEKHLRKNLSEETIIKLKKPKTEEHKQKLKDNHAHLSGKDHPMYGKTGYWKNKKLSENTKEKMRMYKGKNKGPITEKRRLAIIKGIKKKKISAENSSHQGEKLQSITAEGGRS